MKYGGVVFRVAYYSKADAYVPVTNKKGNGMAFQRCLNNAAERSDKGPRKVSVHCRTKTIHDSLLLNLGRE